MNNFFTLIPLLQAESTAPATGSLVSTILTFGAVFAIMYLLVIRPQNKRKKELQNMINTLQKNDKIVTIGGIHGSVVTTRETSVIIKVDEGCKIEFSKSAIANVISRENSEKPAEKDDDKKSANLGDTKTE